MICQICKKRGHGAEKCRFRDPQTRAVVNAVQGNTVICQICSKIGHVAKTCRNNKDNSNKITVICQWCEKPGHSAVNCWQKQNNTGNNTRIICQLCNNFGHNAKGCRFQLSPRLESKSVCRYCKQEGHLLENCQLRIASNNRRNNNINSGNISGPSKMGVQEGTKQTSHPSTSQQMS